jgi:hypothetical protein
MDCPDPRGALGAVARAETHLTALRRADPRFAHCTAGWFEEQVLGLPGRPQAPDAFGWAVVGEVHDYAADERREVWWHAATGRVRTRVVPWVGPLVAEPVIEPRWRYDGARRRWVKTEVLPPSVS